MSKHRSNGGISQRQRGGTDVCEALVLHARLLDDFSSEARRAAAPHQL